MLRDAGTRRQGQERPIVHEFPALVALVDDHLFPHSAQICLWRLMASAKAVLTVGPRMRPQEHEAEYMM